MQLLYKYEVLATKHVLDWAKLTSKTEGDSDESEQDDEVLEIIGEEKRAAHVKAMSQFIEFLKKPKKEKDSSSSEDSDSSDSSSDSSKSGGSKKDSSDKGSSSD